MRVRRGIPILQVVAGSEAEEVKAQVSPGSSSSSSSAFSAGSSTRLVSGPPAVNLSVVVNGQAGAEAVVEAAVGDLVGALTMAILRHRILARSHQPTFRLAGGPASGVVWLVVRQLATWLAAEGTMMTDVVVAVDGAAVVTARHLVRVRSLPALALVTKARVLARHPGDELEAHR